MIRNILLYLRFDGKNFHGWQYQPTLRTVEGEVKKACARILQENVSLHSCSRTDTGVHANMFCLSFKTGNPISCAKLIGGLNAVLPRDVAVFDCVEKPDNFHARFDCLGKEYVYRIWTGKQRNPFLEGYALDYGRKIDVDALNAECAAFVGEHDFSSFCAAGSTVKSNVRTIFDCGMRQNCDISEFFVKGNGFLYNMVRIMVGTLLYMNDGKIPLGTLDDIIASGDRLRAGITAPPEGLYLNEVYYLEEDMKRRDNI